MNQPTSLAHSLPYRRDIDALRGIAVLAVVIFHVVPDWAPGGFIGVDVFFVISGYLITTIIRRDLALEKFSLKQFWARRVQRILPALLVVIVATVVAAWLLFVPQRMADLGEEVVAASLGVANIFYWLNSDYFSVDATSRPLLHAWSLGVEEQFYLILPFALMFLHKKRLMLYLLLGTFVGSFAWSVYDVANDPSRAFYMLPSRWWELMLGSLISFVATGDASSPRGKALREVMALCGVVMVVLPVFFYTEELPFPGVWAIPPCLGAGLVIASGKWNGRTVTARALGNPLLVAVGLISYSFYLWHWPMLVMAKARFGYELTLNTSLTVIGLSAVFATLSWRFVEVPARHPEVRKRPVILFSGAAILVVAVVAVGYSMMATIGYPDRYEGEAQRILSFADSHSDRRKQLMIGEGDVTVESVPVLGDESKPVDFVFWGDSHALAMAETIDAWAKNEGRACRFYIGSSHLPISGVHNVLVEEANERCKKIERILLADDEIKTVVLMARWPSYTVGPMPGSAEASYDRAARIAIDGVKNPSPEELDAAFNAKLEETILRLLENGKKVVLVDPVPEIGERVPELLSKISEEGGDPYHATHPMSVYEGRAGAFTEFFERISNEHAGVDRVRILDKMEASDGTLLYADDAVLYHDDDHLSLEGSRFVLPLFEAALK